MLFEFEQRSDALHLPMWIPQGVVPVALLLIIVMSLVRLLVHEPERTTRRPRPHGSP